MKKVIFSIHLFLFSFLTIGSAQELRINEIFYNEEKGHVEVFGPADFNLEAYYLFIYNGDGKLYPSEADSWYPINKIIPNLDNTGYGVVVVDLPEKGLPIGKGGVVLYSKKEDKVLEFLSYGLTIEGAEGVAKGIKSTDIKVTLDGSSKEETLQLIGNEWVVVKGTLGAFNESLNDDCAETLAECIVPLLDYLEENAPDLECKQWEGSCDITGNIHRKGVVGIGTDKIPNGYMLAVKGGVISEKVTVQLCGNQGWCDYVFDKDYPLLALTEVEDFIQKNKHLPKTPSAAEIEGAGGFELKSVSLNHQEKIEEIFLYLIDLEKEVKALNQEVEKVEQVNKRLKKQKL